MRNQTHRSARIKSEIPTPDEVSSNLGLIVLVGGSSGSVAELDALDGACE